MKTVYIPYTEMGELVYFEHGKDKIAYAFKNNQSSMILLEENFNPNNYKKVVIGDVPVRLYDRLNDCFSNALYAVSNSEMLEKNIVDFHLTDLKYSLTDVKNKIF